MKANLRPQLRKVIPYICMIILATLCISLRNAEADKLSRSSNDNGKKAVRKGTLAFIGEPSSVHLYHRKFICYSHDEMTHQEGERFETPAERGYGVEDYSHEEYPIGLKYISRSKDVKPALITTGQFKYIVDYKVFTYIGLQDSKGNAYPQAAATVHWNSEDAGNDTAKVAQSSVQFDYVMYLGTYAVHIPTTYFTAPKAALDSKTFTETHQEEFNFTEPGRMDETMTKQMKCYAKIGVDGGYESHAEAEAQIKVAVVPAEGYKGYKQFTVREAFNYPGAIR